MGKDDGMGKYIVNTATSYRFIAGLGILGLMAALAVAQKTGQSLRSTPSLGQPLSPISLPLQTLPTSIPSQTTSGLSTNFSNPFTGVALPTGLVESISNSSTAATNIPLQTTSALSTNFINPFTGVAVPTALVESVSNAQSGSSTSGGAGALGGSAATLSGSAFGGTGAGISVLPSITSLPSGGGASGAKGSFCGGYGI
jgi:hypothetical protein